MVKIGFLKDEPIILAAVAAKISRTPFEKGNIEDLYEECRGKELEEKAKKLENSGHFKRAEGLREESRKRIKDSEKLVNRIMRGSRHLIFGDFLPYAITLEDLSRLAAVYLWRNVAVHNLLVGMGLETSLRLIKANRYNKIVSDFGENAFETYEKAIELGVPEQDARYMLPEGTLTRMIFTAPPRYLVKLAHALQGTPLLELQEIGDKIETLVEKKFSFRIPKEELPSKWEFWGKTDIEQKIYLDYGGTIHSLSLNGKIQGSLSMYAQLVRQRQILCCIEPLEGIARKARFVLPKSFPDSARKDYLEIAASVHEEQMKLIEKKDPNFVYFLLLGQVASSIIYGKGAGIIETSRARSEGVAQWEIRNEVGIPLTRELAKHKELRDQIGPRCWREGRCIEPTTFKTRKQVCRAFEISNGNWKGSLEELLDVLSEPYETFTI